jgi:hypothetical protein
MSQSYSGIRLRWFRFRPIVRHKKRKENWKHRIRHGYLSRIPKNRIDMRLAMKSLCDGV